MKHPNPQNIKWHVHLWAILLGFLFTLTLASWWLYYGLKIIKHGQSGLWSMQYSLSRYTMWLYEGTTLIVCLITGGVILIHYVWQTKTQSQQLKVFFATFNHELKTSLASLRLQTEALQDEIKELGPNPLFQRLVFDTVRLQLQLENSLFLAQGSRQNLYRENISITQLIENLKSSWPQLTIQVNGEASIKGDFRALESCFKNLIQNSYSHAKATQITINVLKKESGLLVQIEDNGIGFNYNYHKLGTLFYRPKANSGSGIGLYLVKNLCQSMGGKVDFLNSDNKFIVQMFFANKNEK